MINLLNMFGNKNKINPIHVYESLWRCRDFELSHLWQRSIFLTAFIVLSYTGYGFVLMRICDCLFDKGSTGIGFIFLNIIGFLIALSGIVLSVFWIMMGKGSKAWYEKYEKALYNIERDDRFINSKVSLLNESELMHGSLSNGNINKRLFSTDGGNYSPSRINILIGQLSAILFTLAYVTQTIIFAIAPIVTRHSDAYENAIWKGACLSFIVVCVWLFLIYTNIGRSSD